MREEKIEYEMKMAEISAKGEWIVAEAIEKLETAGLEQHLATYCLFLHGIAIPFSSLDPYKQAKLLHMMDEFAVERLSELIVDGLDVSKTPFANDKDGLLG